MILDNAVENSRLCRAATELAHQFYEPFLLNHCLRSYWFARAAGRELGLKADVERLYVACLLHDLGLTNAAPVQTRFEVEGADLVKKFLIEQGADPATQDIVWDAIALHTTMVIPQRKAPEVALCQLGTAIDIGFAPRSMIPEAAVDVALSRFPRLGFKGAMIDCLCGLAERNRAVACQSSAVVDVAERSIPGFQRTNICDVINEAAYNE